MTDTDQTKGFGDIAQKLARNPLGIIALFIVLVYGFAALVTAFGGGLSGAERLPLVYFLVGFPVLVLAVFTWLVSRHSTKLFAPSDFRDEDNYIRTVTATASLAVASRKTDPSLSTSDFHAVVETVREAGASAGRILDGPYWRNHILWVDDRPDNNIDERRAFEAMGISFTLALSTNEGLEELAKRRFAAIISDMGRKEGPREGYVLLDKIRASGNQTPLFIYASSSAPEHVRETLEHEGQGCTNSPQELFRMVMRTVVSR
jgi:CheY-like chemotaxis protein